MFRSRVWFVFALLFGAAASAVCQEAATDAGDRYLLLARSSVADMQKQLDVASTQGFAVVTGSGMSFSELAILLVRLPEGAGKRSYRVLATVGTGNMEKDLNAAAREGYRLLPHTMTAKQSVVVKQIVVVMERNPDERGKEYEYKVLATTRIRTLQQEIAAAAADGYSVSALASRGEHLVVMEREKNGHAPGANGIL